MSDLIWPAGLLVKAPAAYRITRLITDDLTTKRLGAAVARLGEPWAVGSIAPVRFVLVPCAVVAVSCTFQRA